MFHSERFPKSDNYHLSRNLKLSDWPTTGTRSPSRNVFVLRVLHRVWVILHSQPVYWCDYRQFQYAEEKGESFNSIQ